MSRFRLVVADLDGTLLDPGGQVTEKTRSVARALATAGITLVLATSRRYTGAAPIAKALDMSGPLILCDGAQVREYPGGSILASNALEKQVARLVVEIIYAHGLRPIAQTGEQHGERLLVAPAPDVVWDANYLTLFADQTVEIPIEALCDGGADPLRVVAFGDQQRLRAGADEIATLQCGWQILDMGNYGAAELTVFSPTASKGNTLEMLAERMRIPLSETFAVGDGINDVSLLSTAGFAVAMGNAVDEVRAVAHAVAGPNWEDGAADSILRYVLEAE